jgi:RNA polymerase sigma factor (sigma-70 family)
MKSEDPDPAALSGLSGHGTSAESSPSDELLLKRYASERDETAFAALVNRHGPLVLGVCRRILRHEQDAEDAFQATFMVLARKANSITRYASTGGWLYRVAYRVATKLKRRKARRNMRESDFQDLPAAADSPEWIWRDVRVVLDEEISRLPEKYRLAFILCDLGGKTNEQAARELACPVGTLAYRLAWARKRLQNRLTRRGITLSAGALAAGLAAHGLAAVPPPLAAATIHGAVRFALGQALTAGVVSAELAREYLHGVLRGKALKGAAMLAIFVGVAAVVAWLVLKPGGLIGVDPGRPPTAAPPQPEPEPFRGDWKFVRLEAGGVTSSPETTRMVFTPGQCRIVDPAGVDLPMTFQFDSDREPKTIDLAYYLGNDRVVGRGIYRLVGDQLWICYRFADAAQPPERLTQFATRPNTKEMLFVLERE